MKKEIKLKGAILRGHDFVDGIAVVVGGRDAEPYVNIYNEANTLLVSLLKPDMDRLVKAWGKVRGGYKEGFTARL